METEAIADRYNEGKPDWSYVFQFSKSLDEFCQVCSMGEAKYSRGNYRKGLPLSNLMASAGRHIRSFMSGQDYDDESQRHHLAHAAWNILVALEQQSRPEKYGKFDDREVIE